MKKLISLLLVLILVLSMLPMAVSAAKTDDDTEEEKKPHVHKFILPRYNLKYHWMACSCGQKVGMEPHVDPKGTDDDICICGMRFSDNADLVALWVQDCEPIKDFNKNVTEYTLKTVSYKPVTEVKISTQVFNAQSTVELPEDLTLKEGTNTIPVKVISGNRKNTKTYTLTIINETK